MHQFQNSDPMIAGHEFVGTVEAIGTEVNGFKIGDRVSGEGHLTCGTVVPGNATFAGTQKVSV